MSLTGPILGTSGAARRTSWDASLTCHNARAEFRPLGPSNVSRGTIHGATSAAGKPVSVVCGVCRGDMGTVAPLDCERTLQGLCADCFERGKVAGLEALARVAMARVEYVIHRADARQLGEMEVALEHRREAVLARLGPHALAVRTARRAPR